MVSTKRKIALARALSATIVTARSIVGRSAIVTTRRKGATWRLDLNEGIDFALYFGLYQQLPRRLSQWIRPGDLVLDLGANVGAHTLVLAQMVGRGGCVVAVEPTNYGYGGLTHNIELNPELSQRIIAVQAEIVSANPSTTRSSEKQFYSRWPLRGNSDARHPGHLGQLESASSAKALTLDTLLEMLRGDGRVSGPVSFIKLDVDGHELDVLRGAQRLMEEEHPPMLIEIAPHVQDEVPGRFEELLQTLKAFGYALESAGSGKRLPMSAAELRQHIGEGASIDALALAEGRKPGVVAGSE